MRSFYDTRNKKNKTHTDDKFFFFPIKRKKTKKKNGISLNLTLMLPYILINAISYLVLFYLSYVSNMDKTEMFPNYFIGILMFFLLGLFTMFQTMYMWGTNKIIEFNSKKKTFKVIKYSNYTFLSFLLSINAYLYFDIFFSH